MIDQENPLSKERTWMERDGRILYVDGLGKIIAEVVLNKEGDYETKIAEGTLGRFISQAQAQSAIERHHKD